MGFYILRAMFFNTINAVLLFYVWVYLLYFVRKIMKSRLYGKKIKNIFKYLHFFYSRRILSSYLYYTRVEKKRSSNGRADASVF